MTYIIPSQTTKQIRQPNNNDLLGELYVTKNINLDEEGYIKLSPPAVAIMTTDDDADFLAVDSMHQNAGNLWIPSQDIFTGVSIGRSTLTNRDSDTGSPNAGYEEDSVYFNGTDVVSVDANILYRSATTTWTSVSLSLDSNLPTSMCSFEATAGLMVGNSNIVKLVNTSWAVAVTLTLPVDYAVTSLAVNGATAYIATRHKGGGDAKLFIWDGTSTSSDQSYSSGGTELFSIKEHGSSIAGINSLGQLLRFNGGGFDVLASLPAYYIGSDWSDDSNDHAKVSDRGLVADGSLLYIRLDPTLWSMTDNYIPNFVGGLWCYDPKVGLYCKNTPSYTRLSKETIATADVDVSTNIITVGVVTVPITGTPVIYYSAQSTRLKPLYDTTCYYVIKLSDTTLKLATSYANAIAGTAIDLTTTGNNSQELVFYTPNDYGWTYSGDRGSTLVLSTQTYSTDFAERVIMTAELWAKQDVTTQKSVLNVIQPYLPNRGYFITPRLNSINIQETYPMMYLKFRPLGADDSILIKYRVVDKDSINVQTREAQNSRGGTWTSTTTFTSILDLSTVEVGDEVEIVGGVGAGLLAHVSTITENAGTYTVTLDEGFAWAVNNDLMYFVVTNFKRLETIDNTNKTSSKGYAEVPLINADNTSTFVQLKIELRGIETTISELQVANKTFKKVL